MSDLSPERQVDGLSAAAAPARVDPRPTRPRLLFVSPQFLFPMDAGGKIRSANILKNLKGGAFEIDLISPGSAAQAETWRASIDEICDSFQFWPEPQSGLAAKARRVAGLLTPLPVSVWTDATASARSAVAAARARKPDLVVYDYVHSLALKPSAPSAIPSVVFTHNVETEIFRRHRALARFPMSIVYGAEAMKMARFERTGLRAADGVIAVSEKDAEAFRTTLGAKSVQAIPTGVDLTFFSYDPPKDDAAPTVIFTGSMDWRANQEGLAWFLAEVWPKVATARNDAAFRVIGKSPPDGLVKAAKDASANWTFTGFVDDVRDHARGAVYVIPIRAGSGTRIKAFEAMAMGVPVVSTTVGVEGLDLSPGEHYLNADDPAAFADAVVKLLNEPAERRRLSQNARARVEARQSHAAAASVFESYCRQVMDAARRF